MTKEAKLLPSGAKNAKRCKYAELVAMGMPQQKAFREAGYTAKDTKSEASRLLGQEDVKNALHYWKKLRFKEINVSSNRIIEEQSAIAFSNFLHYLDEKGGIIDPRDLPEELGRAVKKFTVKEQVKNGKVWGKTYELEFHNKQIALDKLVEYKSILSGKKDQKININLKVNGVDILKGN